MNVNKALQRDRKHTKRHSGMQMDNRSIFIIVKAEKKRALDRKREIERKERLRSESNTP